MAQIKLLRLFILKVIHNLNLDNVKILTREKNEGKRKLREVFQTIKNNSVNFKTDANGVTSHYSHILYRSWKWFRCSCNVFSWISSFCTVFLPIFLILTVSPMRNAGRSKHNWCIILIKCANKVERNLE